MDISTIAGLGLALVALGISLTLEGGNFAQLINVSALILIMGGTVGATMISFSLEEMMALPKLIGKAFSGKEDDTTRVIDQIVTLVEKARREGLLTLQNDIKNLDDAFLIRGIELVVDGTDPQAVRSILETDIAFMEKRHKAGAGILDTAGGYAPTMGIIGTVMGLVNVLSHLNEGTDKLGPAIANAFLATFYGIFSANVFFLPLGGKLKAKSATEVLRRELILEGVLSLQAGESPRIVREKLEVFLPPKYKQKPKEGGES
ncbi:MAG: motility protein A [Symbiobacteriia bacterium]